MKKKRFLTAPRENVNSLTAQNVEKKLAPTHQTNRFYCVQPYRMTTISLYGPVAKSWQPFASSEMSTFCA